MPSPLELNKEHFSSDSNREFAIYKSVIQTKPQLSNNCQLLGLEITPSTPYVDIGNIIEVRNSRISLGLIVTEFEMGSRKPIFAPLWYIDEIQKRLQFPGHQFFHNPKNKFYAIPNWQTNEIVLQPQDKKTKSPTPIPFTQIKRFIPPSDTILSQLQIDYKTEIDSIAYNAGTALASATGAILTTGAAIANGELSGYVLIPAAFTVYGAATLARIHHSRKRAKALQQEVGNYLTRENESLAPAFAT